VSGSDPAHAVVGGFSLAFWVAAGIAVIALVTALRYLRSDALVLPREPVGEDETEMEAA
jgi:hypothetical protein